MDVYSHHGIHLFQYRQACQSPEKGHLLQDGEHQGFCNLRRGAHHAAQLYAALHFKQSNPGLIRKSAVPHQNPQSPISKMWPKYVPDYRAVTLTNETNWVKTKKKALIAKKIHKIFRKYFIPLFPE
jgi:hypothetical protein